MKITKLSDENLKLTLTAEELQAYGVDYARLDYRKTETRRAVWCMLDEAQKQTGFDAAQDKVKIRVYPEKNGGCDLYVTRLHDGGAASPEQKTTVPEYVCTEEKSTSPVFHAVYRFESGQTEALFAACAVLYARGYRRESAAYVCGETVYLSVTEITGDTLPYLLDEYGEHVGDDGFLSCLPEFATCIAEENAVLLLGRMAEHEKKG